MNDEASFGPERLRALSVGDEDTRALRMQISVSGGLEAERVQLDAEITGEGHLEGRVENQLTDRAGSFDGQISDARLQDLIELVASEGFVGQPQPALFPPDTTVGSVEITLAGETIGTYLAAVDPNQVVGTSAEAEPISRLLAMILEAAEAMVEGGRDPRQTDGSLGSNRSASDGP
ncbi:MAG TPA: hypothetical protein VES62_07435 [Thermoleophilaceae bacterium]|nr:hypothetical protein [Thermoleophilaceae bacterium]